jgi:NAD(P)-dependent dehydrogenase (short-subunit alcohol dehydrogenase family)
MSEFGGRVAVVTGAGSGIGRALAVGLVQRGARVALSDVDAHGLAETARLIGHGHRTDPLDVTDRAAVLAYAEAVVAEFGHVNQVYNNAGVAFAGDVLGSAFEDIERVVDIDFWGVVNGTKAFLPHLIASGDGHVVNVSSLNGIMAQPALSDYCAAKFGVRGFSEALRGELLTAGHPVRVSVVHPGGVRTNIATAALEHARRTGALVTARDEARTRLYNEKLLKMPASRAARIVVDGVEAGRPRILVGRDAKTVDLLVRLLPRWYPKLAVRLERALVTASAQR